MTTNSVASNSRDVSFHRYGGRKSKVKVSSGLVPSRGSEEEFVPCLSPSFGWLPAIFGIAYLVDTLLSARIFICPASLCVSAPPISPPLLSQGLRSLHGGPVLNPVLHSVTSAKTLLPNKVAFTGTRGWDSDLSFGGHISAHYT